MKKRILSVLLALVLCLSLSAGLLPSAQAIGSGFFSNHTDWHFDLTKEPNRAMTVEELIALMTSYSYWITGDESGETPTDKDGKAPSAWAAPYIRREARMGHIDPARISYSEPATLGFYIRFLASNKGLYSFNAINTYTFAGTEDYTAEELLLLDAAVDYGLTQYTPGMDVSKANLLRKDLEAKYLIPAGPVSLKTSPRQLTSNYPWSMLCFEDTYNYYSPEYNNGWTPWYDEPTALVELENVKTYADDFNLVSMNVQLLNKNGSSGSFFHEDRVALKRAHIELIDFCHEKGIGILLGVYNYYDATTLQAIDRDASAAERIADEIVRYLDTYGFDGVNLDIEQSGSSYRSAYAKLVKAVSTRLRAEGKLFLATVGAFFKQKDEVQSIYDYELLREQCDLVNVILYDDHPAHTYSNGGGSVGEISNLLAVRRRIAYAATRMGADKVMLSVANYGVDFNTKTHKADNLPRQEIDALIARYQAAVQTTSAEVDDAWFTYTDDAGAPHTVFFESDSGVKNRLRFATQFGLIGVSVYYAVSDVSAIYQAAGSRLAADIPFRDVEKDWSYDSIRWAVAEGVTSGTSATTFSPGQTCTRGQVVTFLWRAMGKPEPELNSVNFTDVKAGAYYYKAMLWAVENKVTTGTGATTFAPEKPCTRGQVVTFLWRAKGKIAPTLTGSGFTDVDENAYYYTAMLWAVENKITTGTGASTFSPDRPCTRAQVVTFLCRAVK